MAGLDLAQLGLDGLRELVGTVLDNASPTEQLPDPSLARYSERQLAVANTWATHFSLAVRQAILAAARTCAAANRTVLTQDVRDALYEASRSDGKQRLPDGGADPGLGLDQGDGIAHGLNQVAAHLAGLDHGWARCPVKRLPLVAARLPAF